MRHLRQLPSEVGGAPPGARITGGSPDTRHRQFKIARSQRRRSPARAKNPRLRETNEWTLREEDVDRHLTRFGIQTSDECGTERTFDLWFTKGHAPRRNPALRGCADTS